MFHLRSQLVCRDSRLICAASRETTHEVQMATQVYQNITLLNRYVSRKEACIFKELMTYYLRTWFKPATLQENATKSDPLDLIQSEHIILRFQLPWKEHLGRGSQISHAVEILYNLLECRSRTYNLRKCSTSLPIEDTKLSHATTPERKIFYYCVIVASAECLMRISKIVPVSDFR